MKKKKSAAKANGVVVVTLSDLYRRFGRRAEVVLADYLTLQPREKGKQRTFRVNAQLPSNDQYVRMETATFCKPLSEQVAMAYTEFRTIRNEVEDWHKRLPQGFKVADHGRSIEQCKDEVDILCDEPDVPKSVAGLPVMFIPAEIPAEEESPGGRPERCGNAARRLQACVDAVKEEGEEGKGEKLIAKFVAKLQACVRQANAVKFPSMYT